MNQNEVWLINLDPTIGSEIRKTRPAVIVSDDLLGRLPLRVIVPLTDWKDRYAIAPWMIAIEPDLHNGLTKKSAADAFQIRFVSEKRFIKKLGTIRLTQTQLIKEALSKVLSIR